MALQTWRGVETVSGMVPLRAIQSMPIQECLYPQEETGGCELKDKTRDNGQVYYEPVHDFRGILADPHDAR